MLSAAVCAENGEPSAQVTPDAMSNVTVVPLTAHLDARPDATFPLASTETRLSYANLLTWKSGLDALPWGSSAPGSAASASVNVLPSTSLLPLEPSSDLPHAVRTTAA